MSKLNELIDKQIKDIQFNGCSLPESILRKQFELIVSLAKLEESMEANQRFIDSIGTAFGNGANDQVDAIGKHITEPEPAKYEGKGANFDEPVKAPELNYVNPITN